MAGGSYVGHHPVPGRRAAAAAPGRDHARRSRSATSTATATRTAASRTSSSTRSTSPSRARPARPARTPTRRCSPETLAAKLGPVAVGTIAFDYLARPNDDDFYRDRSPIYRADEIEVPGADHRRLARRPAARRARDVPARSRGARASRRGSTWTRARTRAAARRSRRSPTPPGRLRRAARSSFEFLQKHLRGRADTRAAAGRVLRPGARRVRDAPTAGRRAARASSGSRSATATLGRGRRRGRGVYVTNPAAGFSMAFDRSAPSRRQPVRADRPAARGAAAG